jgi:hypothetical protein
MKKTAMLCNALLLVACLAQAAEPAKGKDAMDPQAMQELMMKAATPGPQHERLKKLEGEWNLTVKFQVDPSQPWQEAPSTATVKSLMDGRYVQEETSGEMMGMPFFGLGITGYDNVLQKYVATWMDNMGTGIMKSEGVADASGKVIRWTGEGSDPMTGKLAKFRMVTTFVDDDHHTFEMFGVPPGQKKEAKLMEIAYARK